MEISRLLLCVVVNCVFVSIVAKSVSLNDLIEAESRHERVAETTSTKLEESDQTSERYSLGLKPLSRKFLEYKREGNLIPFNKKLSPLKYKKTFQIKSPLKLKRVKNSLRNRHKRKNLSVKREIAEDVKLKQKYIPLLRSLSMLFDDILGSESGESFEIPPSKRQRLRYYLGDDAPCECSDKNEDAQSGEEATSAEVISSEVTLEVTTEAAHNPTPSDIRGLRQHKVVPVLLPRNTLSARRNHIGLRERSGSTHNGGSEGDISGDNGDSEYDSERGLDRSGSSSDKKDTDDDRRNSPSGIRFRAIRGGQSRNNTEVDENYSAPKVEAEISVDLGGYDDEAEFEVNGNEAKSAELLQKPVRRFRGLPEHEIVDTAESVQSQQNNEEGDIDVAQNGSNDQRIFDGNGTSATETQEISSEHEELVPPTPSKIVSKFPRRKIPVVTIVDGYSVTRHKNGENKLSGKAIHIRSK